MIANKHIERHFSIIRTEGNGKTVMNYLLEWLRAKRLANPSTGGDKV